MRRIVSALALAGALLAAAVVAERSEACEMLQYTRVKASPHVVVFEAAEGVTGVVNGNIVAVMGRDATLVVDTGQFASIARRVVAELRAMKAPPVTHVLHTHWHGDHLLANAVFKSAWPGAKLVAHSHTIQQAAVVYTDYPAKAKVRLPIVLDDLRKRHDASTSEDERLWLARTNDCLEAIMKETDGMGYVVPDTVVDDALRVDLGGGIAVDIRHLGAGNTPGDLVAWVEADRLLATGDIIVAPVPYAIGSELGPWVATLDRLLALGPKVIVPGHGPVMRDDRYVRDVRALIAGTRTQVEALRAQGVAKADAPARIDTAAFSARYVTTPLRRQAFEQFFVKAAVAKAWPPDPPKPAS